MLIRDNDENNDNTNSPKVAKTKEDKIILEFTEAKRTGTGTSKI